MCVVSAIYNYGSQYENSYWTKQALKEFKKDVE